MHRLLFHTSRFRRGRVLETFDVSLEVGRGEGETTVGGGPPTLGTVTDGTVCVASERFPRLAPLHLTLRGADLRFVLRAGKLVAVECIRERATLLRLSCQGGLWTTAIEYELFWRTLTPSSLDIERIAPVVDASPPETFRTPLELEILDGEIAPGPGFERETSGRVRWSTVDLKRGASGGLTFRMHGARVEWEVADGRVSGLRVYESRGVIADLAMLGPPTSVALLDSLP